VAVRQVPVAVWSGATRHDSTLQSRDKEDGDV
jgi:hypothetical protein